MTTERRRRRGTVAALAAVFTACAGVAVADGLRTVVQGEGLEVHALLLADPDWQSQWDRPEAPRLEAAERLTPGGSATVGVVFRGPAVRRPGFGLDCAVEVSSREQGPVGAMPPTDCATGGELRPDVFYAARTSVTLDGRPEQSEDELRFTVRVTERASGETLTAVLALPVAASE